MHANSEDKQDKTTTQARRIHSSIKQEQILMKQEIFFWASVWNLLFLPGSIKPLVSNFCIYTLRISMLWGLATDSMSFLKQHVQQKVMGIFSNLSSLITQSRHIELFIFPACCKQEWMKPLTRCLWGSTPILQLHKMTFLLSWMLDWWRTLDS